MGGKTSAASKNKWLRDHKDRVNLVLDQGQKDKIKTAADRHGQSLNAYIVEAIENRMEKESNVE